MSNKELYEGWFKTSDDDVHVWPAQSRSNDGKPKVTKLPEVGPAGMMKGVYAPRDHREFVADRPLVCSGDEDHVIQAGDHFRFVGKRYKFRRPICNDYFEQGRYLDVWKAFGFTPKPDYSGADMPEHFYRYGRTKGGPKIE